MIMSLISEGLIASERCTLCENHMSIALLSEDDPRHIQHYKKFVQNLVESLKWGSDGSLFSVVLTASVYPSDVVALVLRKKNWARVLKARAMLTHTVMKKWPGLLRRTLAPVELRDFQGRDAQLLQYFKYYVREMVEKLKHSYHDGTLPLVLRTAAMYPLEIQEMAVSRFRGSVMREAQIFPEIMGQWECLLALDRISRVDPGSDAHVCSSVACGDLLMDILDKIQDVNDFPDVLRLFPVDAVYSVLVTRRVLFRKRFRFIAEDVRIWKRIVNCWAREVKPQFESLYAQAGLVINIRWALAAHRRNTVKSQGVLTVEEYLERFPLTPEQLAEHPDGVDFSYIALFDTRYHEECERAEADYTSFVRDSHLLPRPLFKRALLWRVVGLVATFKDAAISVLGDEFVSNIRKVAQKVVLSKAISRPFKWRVCPRRVEVCGAVVLPTDGTAPVPYYRTLSWVKMPLPVDSPKVETRKERLLATFLSLTANLDTKRALVKENTKKKMAVVQGDLGLLTGGATGLPSVEHTEASFAASIQRIATYTTRGLEILGHTGDEDTDSDNA